MKKDIIYRYMYKNRLVEYERVNKNVKKILAERKKYIVQTCRIMGIITGSSTGNTYTNIYFINNNFISCGNKIVHGLDSFCQYWFDVEKIVWFVVPCVLPAVQVFYYK